MTLTETRPAAPARPAAGTAPGGGWVSTGDHKRLGLLYVSGAVLALVVLTVTTVVLHARLGVDAGTAPSLTSIPATPMLLVVLAPLWLGLATYVVPLQIGARRLALPRLQAFSLWVYALGAAVLAAAYILGSPVGEGLSNAAPLPAPRGGADTEALLWIAGLMLLAGAAVVGAVGILTTIVTCRAPGMTLGRMPLFSWAAFATNGVVLLATPVFLAGLVLLYVDQRYGGTFFARGTRGTTEVWLHSLWLYGRPEVYLVLVPALGAAAEVVAVHARRPLVRFPVARGAVIATALLSFAAWAANRAEARAVVLPTYSVPTALIALPVLMLVLGWLDTLRQGRLRLHVSGIHVVAMVVVLGLGALNAVAAAIAGLEHEGSWRAGQVHLVVFGAPLLGALAALHHWGPKALGRLLPAAAGVLSGLLVFGGVVITGSALSIAGLVSGATNGLLWLGFAGSVVTAVGILAFAGGAAAAAAGRGEAAGDDPWQGFTLEWATASPPPALNFTTLPKVSSPHPLLDEPGAAAVPAGPELAEATG